MITPQLENIHERLARVVTENLPWQKLIARYDRPGTLFFLDPPYWGNEDDYGKAFFSREQFEEMAKVLGSLRGRFILSLTMFKASSKRSQSFTWRKSIASIRLVGMDIARSSKRWLYQVSNER